MTTDRMWGKWQREDVEVKGEEERGIGVIGSVEGGRASKQQSSEDPISIQEIFRSKLFTMETGQIGGRCSPSP